MFDYLQKLLGASGLAPHGYCLLWDPALIWTHVIADALIGLAYFSIPVALAVFVTKRPDVRYRWVAWLFVAFILACGTTHFMSIWTLWYPDYGPEALLKLLTAMVSVATAAALWPLLPKALALPTPSQLQMANDELTLRVAERDAALTALASETEERLRTEALLRQAQKMEAVGQLTGGIAHDFNNLLTIIIANIDRVRRLTPADARVSPALDNALAGATTAARLTDQLLAYARRQPLRAEVQDLNAIVTRILALVDGSLGDGIRVTTRLAADLWSVRIDTTQAENAVLNLVVNARDAMRVDGRLEVITRNRDDGQVELVIADTGDGMDAATRDRAFEPFFTTKTLGQGTGLGLSQVYGFITQSNGTVAIDSTPGAGTTIHIFLPRARMEKEN